MENERQPKRVRWMLVAFVLNTGEAGGRFNASMLQFSIISCFLVSIFNVFFEGVVHRLIAFMPWRSNFQSFLANSALIG